MKNSKILLVAAIAILGAACTPKAQINGTISGLTTGDTLTVNVLDVNVLKEKTKVAVEADGSFKVTIPASDVDPDIIYLSCKGYILPSLIVFPKDNITVVADTLGAFSVSGSQECERLAEYQKEFSRTNAKLDAIEAKINAAEDIKEYTREFSKELLDHYRYALKYVITNNKSLTSIQVLNQSIGPYSDVLMRHTDAFTFKTACDTLETVYPKS
ncbi:MAG: hypothetical protein HUJ95_04150, partial [Bacteroidales bacterium]|nr:hypothetical protein [Bacteroidales bacterium]